MLVSFALAIFIMFLHSEFRILACQMHLFLKVIVPFALKCLSYDFACQTLRHEPGACSITISKAPAAPVIGLFYYLV